MSNNKDQELVAFVSSGCAILSHRDITIRYNSEVLTEIVSHSEPLPGNPFPVILNIEVLVSLMLSLLTLCKLRCKTRRPGYTVSELTLNKLEAHSSTTACKRTKHLSTTENQQSYQFSAFFPSSDKQSTLPCKAATYSLWTNS
jgi:hypothetical protein